MADSYEKKMENVVDLEYDQTQTNEAFTMAFCYPKSGPILIKGALDTVLKYMKENLNGVYHYRLSHWRKGRKRGKWYIQSEIEKLSFKESRKGGSRTYNLIFNQFGFDVIIETFKTIPHEYINNFDLFQIGL